MPVTLFVGPMFSGKTTHLISTAVRLKNMKKLIVKHSIDTRFTSSEQVISHDGLTLRVDDNTKFVTTDRLFSIPKDMIDEADALLIEEGQFFHDLYSFAIFYCHDKSLFVSALLSDYRMKPFPSTINCCALADHIEHLKSRCALCGAETAFTARVSQVEGPQILVGAADLYEARCRAHHPRQARTTFKSDY